MEVTAEGTAGAAGAADTEVGSGVVTGIRGPALLLKGLVTVLVCIPLGVPVTTPVAGAADREGHGGAGVGRSCRGGDKRARDFDREFGTVGPAARAGERKAGACGRAEPGQDAVEILPRSLGQEQAVVSPQKLRPGVAEELFRGRIRKGN